MLNGDFWLRSDGSAFDMGGAEHAEEAKRFLLKLPDTAAIPKNLIYTGITDKEATAALRRKVPENVVAYLQRETNDPRAWLVQKDGWIRVAGSMFNLWVFDQKTLDTLRRSDYWTKQPNLDPHDMVDIDEMSTGEQFSVSVAKLKSRASDPAALKRMALGVGRYRNPLPKQSGASFNAWISPLGEVNVINDGVLHSRWMLDEYGRHYNQALAEGWIRLSIAGFSILEVNDLWASLPTIQDALLGLYKRDGNREIWVEDHGGGIGVEGDGDGNFDAKLDLATLVLGSREDIEVAAASRNPGEKQNYIR